MSSDGELVSLGSSGADSARWAPTRTTVRQILLGPQDLESLSLLASTSAWLDPLSGGIAASFERFRKSATDRAGSLAD